MNLGRFSLSLVGFISIAVALAIIVIAANLLQIN